MRVLITGFEPYLDYTENSSWVVAEQLSRCALEGAEVVAEMLPVSFGRVGKALRSAIALHTPDLVIMLGQSGGSDRVKLERVALNMMDACNADNDGYLPDEEPIDEGKSGALFCNVDIKALREAIAERGVAVKISNSAGLYVCNRTYYEALTICVEQPSLRALFVHLPFYEGQSTAKPQKPTLPLGDMICAIQTIIEEINDKDREV